MPRRSSKIWDYYDLINTDGKKVVKCRYCRTTFLQLNATKLKNHFVSVCKQCPDEIKCSFQDHPPQSISSPMASTSQGQIEGNHRLEVSLPTPSLPLQSPGSATSSSSFNTFQDTSLQSPRSMSAEEKTEIDMNFARAIYGTGVPLNLLESKLWQKAITSLRSDYTVPTRYMISNNFLDSEYERIKRETTQIVNNSEALGLVMDGWSDRCGRGMINFIITTPKPLFYKCVHPGTNRETAAYMFRELKTVVDEIGPTHFVAVITDNTSNMKAMWRLVENEHPHITAIGCVSHTLNLLLKDILKLEKFSNAEKMVAAIIKYIKKRHVELAYFHKMQHEKYGKDRKSLKLPSKTRWGACVIMMESFLCNREALEATAIWQELRFDREMKQHILSEDIWLRVESLNKVLKPIFTATTKLEADKATLSEVPKMFEHITENVKNFLAAAEDISNDEKNLIFSAIEKRRQFVEKPIHYAANILDPKYRGTKLSADKIAAGLEFIHTYAQLKNMDANIVMCNLAQYRAKSDYFSQNGIWAAVVQLEPRTWWKGFCDSQLIAGIAIQILSVPPSSAASERNWSLFGNTQTLTRNRLTTDRLQKLIAVRANLRLLSENCEAQFQDSDEDTSLSGSDDDGDEASIYTKQQNENLSTDLS